MKVPIAALSDEALKSERQRLLAVVARCDDDLVWCDAAIASARYTEERDGAKAQIAVLDAELVRRGSVRLAS